MSTCLRCVTFIIAAGLLAVGCTAEGPAVTASEPASNASELLLPIPNARIPMSGVLRPSAGSA